MDFGRTTDTFNTVINAGVAAGLVGATRTINTDIREPVFRIGVNYAFSGVAAASFLKVRSQVDWGLLKSKRAIDQKGFGSMTRSPSHFQCREKPLTAPLSLRVPTGEGARRSCGIALVQFHRHVL
jgi:hypothetical protein